MRFMVRVYPHIARRYLATVIDGLFIFSLGFALAYAIQSTADAAGYFRAAIFLLVLLLYEPVLTSKRCTPGQKIMGVRVRRVGSLQRISVVSAYLRILVKILLGFYSFLSIPFSRERRGVHDNALRSPKDGIQHISGGTLTKREPDSRPCHTPCRARRAPGPPAGYAHVMLHCIQFVRPGDSTDRGG
jgi:hypothetical protein